MVSGDRDIDGVDVLGLWGSQTAPEPGTKELVNLTLKKIN